MIMTDFLNAAFDTLFTRQFSESQGKAQTRNVKPKTSSRVACGCVLRVSLIKKLEFLVVDPSFGGKYCEVFTNFMIIDKYILCISSICSLKGFSKIKHPAIHFSGRSQSASKFIVLIILLVDLKPCELPQVLITKFVRLFMMQIFEQNLCG